MTTTPLKHLHSIGTAWRSLSFARPPKMKFVLLLKVQQEGVLRYSKGPSLLQDYPRRIIFKCHRFSRAKAALFRIQPISQVKRGGALLRSNQSQRTTSALISGRGSLIPGYGRGKCHEGRDPLCCFLLLTFFRWNKRWSRSILIGRSLFDSFNGPISG